jgi:hypothetical protein
VPIKDSQDNMKCKVIKLLRLIKHLVRPRRPKQSYEIEFPEVDSKYLVLYDEGNFIIAVDTELDLDWETTDAFENKTSAPDKQQIGSTRTTATRLEGKVGKLWPKAMRLHCKRMIGEAMARAYSLEHAESQKAIQHAEAFIRQKSIEVSRYWILLSCFVFACGILLIGAALTIDTETYAAILGKTFHLILQASCLGGIGAFLSVITRLGSFQINSEAGLALHFAEAGAKIAAGSICGFLMALLISAGIILPACSAATNSKLGLLALSMVAGMSARWVPNILAKVQAATDCPDEQGEDPSRTSEPNKECTQ